MSDLVLFALRLLAALLLLAFLGVVLLALLRDGRPAAPAPAPPARLVPLPAPPREGGGGRELRSPAWVGRNPNCAICLDDAFVSARHARIEWRVVEQTWWVEDNLSRNGTWLNGVRVSQAAFRMGDELRFGDVAFRVTGS